MGYTFGSIIDVFQFKNCKVHRIELKGNESLKGIFFCSKRYSDAGGEFEKEIVKASGKPKQEIYGRDAAPTCAYKITNDENVTLYIFFEGPYIYYGSGMHGIKEE